jgi:predicted CXXCH cytochrome family protein
MLRALLLACLLGLSPLVTAALPGERPDPAWIGVEACQGCHAEETDLWQGSHHDLAMQAVTEATVLGDFDDAVFRYAGLEHRFYRKQAEFWISTDGVDGKLQDFKVEYVFGVYPLQQYLLALPGGRLQALSIAWDSRSEEEGGQRWYHLHPDEAIRAGNPLHWTGPYYNWNARCAECHSTKLDKRFDVQTAEYATTWTEVNVSCEACHGPGRLHQQLAENGELGARADGGFAMSLAERGHWLFPEGEAIARRQPPLRTDAQINSCARCHSRRGSLGDNYHFGRPLLDTHRLSLLEAPLYHADGQIDDEVYVHGSFIQSKMQQAGVVCSNCHEPHSLALRAPENGVCAQCHKPDVYDNSDHHHHRAGSDGALCANCHMPEKTYMGVDPRRDHSMRIPRPDLSVVIGTPNACTSCHQDNNAEWAVNALREWGVHFTDTSSHPARAIAQARAGDARAVPELQVLANGANTPPIWRATAMAEMGNFATRETYDTAVAMLASDEPLLRMAAIRALEFMPRQQLYGLLSQHLRDPSMAVRMEIARVLAGLPLAQLDSRSADQLKAIYDEYLRNLGENADMPETQVQLGAFFAAREFWQPAEIAYQRALQLNPQDLTAMLNLADLYRTLQREDEARQLLMQAVAIAPEQGTPYHALGLLETRAGNRELAMGYLQDAAERETNGVRHRYVYAIALYDHGDSAQAIEVLKTLLRGAPENPDVLLALVTYCKQTGRVSEAKRYAERLKNLAPNDAGVQQLYDSL